MTMVFSAVARHRPGLVALLLTGLCLALPTHNSTVDAWAYAAQVRYGQEFYAPHHLWHNLIGWLWLRALAGLGLRPDVLAGLKALNALSYGVLLLVLGRLLRRLGGPTAPVAAWALAVGSSWGLLRFATENETYMLPLLASLLASAAWVRWAMADRAEPVAAAPAEVLAPEQWLLAAGAGAAGAALLHQLQALWWLGLLVATVAAPARPAPAAALGWPQRGRRGLLFAAPALLLWPAAYAAALPTWGLPLSPSALWHFALHDFYSGVAGRAGVAHGAALTLLSLVRTWVQGHGYFLPLLRHWPALPGVAALCAGLGWYAVVGVLKARPLLPRAAGPAGPVRFVALTHAGILGLHLAFAAHSDGNAEFMVMLPVLGSIVALGLGAAWLPARAVAATGTALLLWNLAFGLLPLHRLRLQNTAPLFHLLHRQPQARLLLTDPNLLLNQNYYATGHQLMPQVLPSPAALLQRFGTAARASAWLHRQPAAGSVIYTDAVGNTRPLDRAWLAYGGPPAALLAGFQAVPADSGATIYGEYRVMQLVEYAEISSK